MKNLVYILLTICALVCGTWAWCNSRNAKTAELRLQAQKKQAAANEARAKAMEAKEKKEAEEKSLAAKNAEAKAAEDNRKAAEDNRKAAEDNRKKAEAEAKTAEDNRRIAEANRKKAEAEAAAAKDRRLAAEAAAKRAEATNEMRHAELEIAREARLKANIDLKAKETAREVEELKKADYDKLIKDAQAIQAVLREREEATRPDRTLKDLLADNEVEPAEQELSPEELAEQAAAESNRVAKIARRQTPKTRGDNAIADAEARLGRIAEEGGKVVRAKARARLEALASKATREGRKAAAEYYRAQAKELFGDDSGNAAEEPERRADGGTSPGGNPSEAVRE